MHTTPIRRHRALRLAGVVVALAIAACGGNGDADDETGSPASTGGEAETLHVVASTDIIADLVDQVGGERVRSSSIVPTNGDPHSYEPSPSDARNVGEADVVFTNGLLLEEHSITKIAHNNAAAGVPVVPLAENAEAHGATLLPLVEDLGLDVLWLGLAVQGDIPEVTAEINVSVTAVEGPGDFFVYLNDALGTPELYFDSSDGFDDTDVAVLPPAAHTHVNWAFTVPGEYTMALSAEIIRQEGGTPEHLADEEFRFVVDGDPPVGDTVVLGDGHTDLAVNTDTGEIFARTDEHGDLAADDVVIHAIAQTREEVPEDPRFAFLGNPGDDIWILPQAVLGKHVHGEVDPHLWLDPKNTKTYVQTIADTLATADPDGAEVYAANAADYLARLDELDRYVAETLAEIPLDHRKLITTHDAFGYLAAAYDLRIVGFVVPNPGQDPSAAQVSRLNKTIEEMEVPAVFLEPNLAARADVLRRVAEDQGVQMCTLYGDSLHHDIASYVEFMTHNADELARCLGESAR